MKKNKMKPFALLIVMAFSLSCQKQNNNTPSGNGGGSAATTNPNISPSNASNWFGILDAYNLQSLTGGVLQPTFKTASAFFSNAAQPSLNPSSFVKVNQAELGSVIFKFSTYDYVDTTFNLSFTPLTWKINGLGSIPSFTFTNTNSFPAYSGYASLPDTVHIGTQITISITGITGADQVIVAIWDGSNLLGHTQSQVLGTGSSVTFPASSLSSLNATNSGMLVVSGKKNNVQNVGTLPMNFTTNYQLSKTISIK